MYTPAAIANLAIDANAQRTPLGLNKLVYMVHGHGLLRGRGLLCEAPEVWRYGPVYRSLYEALQPLGSTMVARPIRHGGTMPYPTRADHDLILEIVNGYRMVPDRHLSSICHSEESPWKTIAKRCGFRVDIGTTIPDQMILEHFAGFQGRSQED